MRIFIEVMAAVTLALAIMMRGVSGSPEATARLGGDAAVAPPKPARAPAPKPHIVFIVRSAERGSNWP